MASDIYTKVTIKEREFVIKKFDAKTGMKLARLVMAKAKPLVPLLAAESKENGGQGITQQNTFQAIFAILEELNDEDIDALVDKCLRVCYVDLPAGRAPVIDEAGFYGVDGVEYDPTLTMMLCFEAIKWGAADFFDESSSISNLFKR